MIELVFEEETQQQQQKSFGAVIKVIGIGGAGGNAVNSMVNTSELQVVDFIVANTDAQALSLSPAFVKIQLGQKITKGLGAGANPEIGRRAAEEDLGSVVQYLKDVDILFLTAGLGGGTGSGAIPVIAGAAKELGVLTVAVVTKPFAFEGKRRAKHAADAIDALQGVVDTLIIVPNQKLLEIVDSKISMLGAFALSNNILKQAIKGIADIIAKPGLINVDFADIKTIMKDMGMAVMGTGSASGQDRARVAALQAINSPLLENASIAGARGVLINVAGNKDLQLQEISDAATMIYEMVSEDANIILGSVIDDSLQEEIVVTVIATGCQVAQVAAVPEQRKFKQDVVSEEKLAEPIKIEQAVVAVEQEQCVSCEPHDKDLQDAAKSMIEMIDDAACESIKAKPLLEQAIVVEESKDIEHDSIMLRAGDGLLPLHEETLLTPNGSDDSLLDPDDLDTPTFMRKKSHKGGHKEI